MSRSARLLTALIAAGSLALAPAAAAAPGWVWPLGGEVVTSYRNGDDPYAAGQHRGIDIAGAVGSPVVAATDGEVTFAGVAGSSGLTVSVRTATGVHDTSYLHLSAAAVRKGDRVTAGQQLGEVGTSGTRSVEQPHLHFGVRMAGIAHAYVDPLGLLGPPPAAPAPQAPPAAPVVPVAAPLRVPQAAPEPAPRPAPVPRPLQVPVTRGVPAARRVRAPHAVRSPQPVRAPVPHRLPAARPLPAAPVSVAHRPQAGPGQDSSAPLPAPGLHRPRAVAASSRALAALGPAPADASRRGDDTPPEDAGGQFHDRPAEAGANRGPDAGWALACLALLLAAALLGTGRGGRAGRNRRPRAAASGRRGWIAALVRPLTGRG